MSSLRSTLEEWRSEDLAGVDVDRLAADLVELDQVVGLVEVERARRLVVFEERGGHHRHGFSSVTGFLVASCRMAWGRARRLVAVAHAGRVHPGVLEAWGEQRVSMDQAHRLLEAAQLAPEEFGEADLVGIVEPLGHGDTRRALAYWLEAVRGPGVELAEQTCEEMRVLSLSRTGWGMGRIDGWLTPSAYEVMAAALDALLPPPGEGDVRSAGQRRHDALEALARDYLDHGETPVVGGEKPHLNVVTDLDALAGKAGGRHEYESGQVLTVAELRRLACDCSVTRIVLGPDSEVLDVGRRTRVVSPGLRRAVIARDHHCVWWGCCQKPRWCDVHHIVHWGDNGVTELCNLVLLCRYHHRLVHRIEAGEQLSPAVMEQYQELQSRIRGP